MKGFKPLILKGILKKHKGNPKDKSLHKIIEKTGIKKETFNKLIKEATKHKPFDKEKN